jgi:activating signal cointegrator 1
MKALSLTQPWASAIALGIKHYETRSWPTKFRGDFCIHAAKGFPRYAQDFFEDQLQEGLLPPDADLPRGAIIAVCSLTACLGTEDVLPTIERVERMYGNYEPKRYAYRLENVRVLAEPVFCKGALSFWPVGWDQAVDVMRKLPIDHRQAVKFA